MFANLRQNQMKPEDVPPGVPGDYCPCRYIERRLESSKRCYGKELLHSMSMSWYERSRADIMLLARQLDRILLKWKASGRRCLLAPNERVRCRGGGGCLSATLPADLADQLHIHALGAHVKITASNLVALIASRRGARNHRQPCQRPLRASWMLPGFARSSFDVPCYATFR